MLRLRACGHGWTAIEAVVMWMVVVVPLGTGGGDRGRATGGSKQASTAPTGQQPRWIL